MSGLSRLSPKRPSTQVPTVQAEGLGRLHVDIPADLLKAAKLHAVQNDKSLRDLVIDALSGYLSR